MSNTSQVWFCFARNNLFIRKRMPFNTTASDLGIYELQQIYMKATTFTDTMYYANLHSTHTFYTSIDSHRLLEHSFRSVGYSRKYSITFAIRMFAELTNLIRLHISEE
jgi:hypothetical protein